MYTIFCALGNGLAQVRSNLRANFKNAQVMFEVFAYLALYAAVITFLVKGVIVYCNRTASEP